MNGFCSKGKCICNTGFSSEDCSQPFPLLENNKNVNACSLNNYANPDNVSEQQRFLRMPLLHLIHVSFSSFFFCSAIFLLTSLNRSAEIPVQSAISSMKDSVFLVIFHAGNALTH